MKSWTKTVLRKGGAQMNLVVYICKDELKRELITKHNSESESNVQHFQFVEQPSCHSLDICENKWYHLIDAQINIPNMILPHVK